MNEHFPEQDFYVNINHRSPEYAISNELKHHHNSFEIFYLETGSRSLLVNGKLYELSPRDLIIIPPNSLHYHIGHQAYENYTMHFSTRFLAFYLSDYLSKYLTQKLGQCVIHLSEKEATQFKNAFQHLKDEYDSHALSIGYLVLILQQLRHLIPQQKSAHTPTLSKNGQMLDTTIKYIYSNYNTITSIDDIVKHSFMSRSYLCKLFKEEFGQGIMHFLLEVKLEHARKLLHSTDLNISVIASQCGFQDNSHFSKAFHKSYGMTPREYRKSLSH